MDIVKSALTMVCVVLLIAGTGGSVGCGGNGGGVGEKDGGVDANVHQDGAAQDGAAQDGAAQDASPGDDAASQPDAGQSPQPECLAPTDCTLHSDCCNCLALAPGEQPPPCPITECFVDACTPLNLDPSASPLCPAGHCSAGANCDDSTVVCMQPTPACDPGWVPSVLGACWGPCVRASECASVPDCNRCDPTFYLCVTNSAWIQSHHCVDVPTGCEQDRSCGCLSSAVCVGIFDLCHDSAAVNEIQCECPTC